MQNIHNNKSTRSRNFISTGVFDLTMNSKTFSISPKTSTSKAPTSFAMKNISINSEYFSPGQRLFPIPNGRLIADPL
jgi:hypothetical protein